MCSHWFRHVKENAHIHREISTRYKETSHRRSYSFLITTGKQIAKIPNMKDVPFMVFSTSPLHRCKHPLTKCSSSSVTLWGAGCRGTSKDGLHWVKGLCIGVLCVAVCKPSDGLVSSGSVWLQKDIKHSQRAKQTQMSKQQFHIALSYWSSHGRLCLAVGLAWCHLSWVLWEQEGLGVPGRLETRLWVSWWQTLGRTATCRPGGIWLALNHSFYIWTEESMGTVL